MANVRSESIYLYEFQTDDIEFDLYFCTNVYIGQMFNASITAGDIDK